MQEIHIGTAFRLAAAEAYVAEVMTERYTVSPEYAKSVKWQARMQRSELFRVASRGLPCTRAQAEWSIDILVGSWDGSR